MIMMMMAMMMTTMIVVMAEINMNNTTLITLAASTPRYTTIVPSEPNPPYNRHEMSLTLHGNTTFPSSAKSLLTLRNN